MDDVKNLGQCQPAGLTVGPAGQALGDWVEPSHRAQGVGGDDGVANGLQGHLQQLMLSGQFGCDALGLAARIEQGSFKPAALLRYKKYPVVVFYALVLPAVAVHQHWHALVRAVDQVQVDFSRIVFTNKQRPDVGLQKNATGRGKQFVNRPVLPIGRAAANDLDQFSVAALNAAIGVGHQHRAGKLVKLLHAVR